MWHRKPVVAGSFYPSNPIELHAVIENYLKEADKPDVGGEIIGLISPHAGYIYSGPIAAYSFKHLIDSEVDVAVVLAPSHRARFDGASVISEGIYETPLGEVEIDTDIGSKLIEKDNFGFIKEAHEQEHSLEVQVPFIQSVVKNFKIVPIIIGTINLDICRVIANGISEVLKDEKRKIAIVISTDLSHYHSYSEANSIDNRFIESLKTFDEAEVSAVVNAGKAEACGEGPVLTGMILCKNLGAKKVEILKHASSGDTAGDKKQVVGYLSAAFVK